MHKLAWHFDFHGHGDVRVGHAPDPAGAAAALAAAGVEEIITFAKGHCGYTYYPTALEHCYAHPRMQGDPFGDLVKACQARGVRVLAYISFGIDGEGGRRNPKWRHFFANGPFESDDWFVYICPYTGYVEESVLPQIDEIIQRYDVDGFFFDTMSALGTCYCEACTTAFREAHGAEPPRDEDDPNWGAFGRFRHDRGMALIARIGRFIRERKPDAKVGFNQIGTVRHPERMPEDISCLTLDFATMHAQSLQASLCAAYGSTADLPADVMNTIFNQGWGDWSPRPLPALEQVAAAIWARGCRPYIGDRLHPANRLDPATLPALQHLSSMAEHMAAQHPAEDAAIAPDILLLHGPRQMYGADYCNYARGRAGLKVIEGAHRLLLDAGANFAIVSECFLAERLGGVGLVVLPELDAVEPETDAMLRTYVESGGKLLISGRLPQVGDNGLLDWAGLTVASDPWQDHVYLPAWDGAEEDALPVLVRGDFHQVSLAGAENVLAAIPPHDCRHGLRFGWGIAPPAEEPAPHAALTRYRVGAGDVWFLAAPIFADYAENGNWTQFPWIRSLLEHVLPCPRGRVLSAAGTVEMVLHANAASTWAFLINHGGEQTVGCTAVATRGWTRTLGPLPPYPVTLQLRMPEGREPKRVVCGDMELAYETGGADGCVEGSGTRMISAQLVLDTPWRIVRVDWN